MHARRLVATTLITHGAALAAPAASRGEGPNQGAAPVAPRGGFLGVALNQDGPVLRVVGVEPGSPAETAGIQVGDAIVAARGAPVGSVRMFTMAVRAAGPGNTFDVVIERGGQRRSLNVTLGTQPPPAVVAVGQPAPAFNTQVVMGPGPGNLAQLRGRVVLLDFWASWCGPCRATMPALNQLHQRFAAQGLTVLGVTGEDSPSVARYVGTQLGLSYTLATDVVAAGRYQVRSLPTVVLIDRRGTIRRISVGADPTEMRELDRAVRQLLAEPAP